MNLECLNTIITDNLAIHIDLTNINSWRNWNTGFTAFSLTKWTGAISDNINLYDFGLTAYDNGRLDTMWKGITLTPKDTLFSVYRIGANIPTNPSTGNTSGVTTYTYWGQIHADTGGTNGRHFYLDGSTWLQGFFKLQDYNYELFPARYNYGITIETVIEIYPNSQGIFYMMGARAEDKYNPVYSGESTTGMTATSGITVLSGVSTSENNYLDALIGTEEYKKAFRYPEDDKKTVYTQPNQIDNLKNNAIAFELTSDKRLGYKYIDGSGLIIENTSPNIIHASGFTIIDIVFAPDAPIDNPDPDVLMCAPRRTGTLIFYVNGRAHWTINGFPEFFFHDFNNQKEKVLGVPYSIGWGGGSYGLSDSYHYDFQTYIIYNNQDNAYINSHFTVKENPLDGTGIKTGLSLSADTTFFTGGTVMRIVYTGTTGNTGNTYFVKFNSPVSVLSNRDYKIKLSMYDDGFLDGNSNNTISIFGYSNTTDISIMESVEYQFPVFTPPPKYPPQNNNTQPFADEYEYVIPSGEMFYGPTGTPVYDEYGNLITQPIYVPKLNTVVSGQGSWWDLSSLIRTEENSGQKFIQLGLLIETSGTININAPLYIKNFTYTAADILVNRDGGLILNNFGVGYIGGIQKLRLYDKAFSSTEVLHNAMIEAQTHPDILVSKGGRIIYR